MKILNPKAHGVLDYALAIAFLIVPGIFGFTDSAATLSYVIGVVYIVASLITRYPLGAFKLLPFPVHGVIETIMAVAWLVMPWLFGFADDAAARNWFLLAGIALLAVAAMTDYRAAEARVYEGEDRRQGLNDRRRRSMAVARERRMGLGDRRTAGAF